MLEKEDGQGVTTGLAERWRNHDETMPEVLFGRFSEPVCRLAERLLWDRLKRKMDGEDIAQSVFRTLFRHASNGEYNFQHTGAIWRMLAKITKRKVSYWERYYKTGRRDIGREIETKPEIIDGLCEQRDSMADRESAKELAEAIELVLRCLNERDAGIFSALYDEHILTLEIAERFSCSVATVNRVLTRIENRICFLLKRDDD